jgi:hypothetical protein
MYSNRGIRASTRAFALLMSGACLGLIACNSSNGDGLIGKLSSKEITAVLPSVTAQPGKSLADSIDEYGLSIAAGGAVTLRFGYPDRDRPTAGVTFEHTYVQLEGVVDGTSETVSLIHPDDEGHRAWLSCLNDDCSAYSLQIAKFSGKQKGVANIRSDYFDEITVGAAAGVIPGAVDLFANQIASDLSQEDAETASTLTVLAIEGGMKQFVLNIGITAAVEQVSLKVGGKVGPQEVIQISRVATDESLATHQSTQGYLASVVHLGDGKLDISLKKRNLPLQGLTTALVP